MVWFVDLRYGEFFPATCDRNAVACRLKFVRRRRRGGRSNRVQRESSRTQSRWRTRESEISEEAGNACCRGGAREGVSPKLATTAIGGATIKIAPIGTRLR